MSHFLSAIAVFLLLTLVGGLQRVAHGPSRADRMLAAQLFGTTGVGILLILGEVMEAEGARDVALVFGLLALVNVFAFIHRHGKEGDPSGE